MSAPAPPPSSVGFLGCGSMAGAVLARLIDQRYIAPQQAFASARSRATLQRLDGLRLPPENLLCGPDANVRLVRAADVVVLGVKPQVARTVLAGLSHVFDPSRHLLVSLVAGMSAENHAESLGHAGARIVRAIPSMAARIGRSTTAMVAGEHARPEDVARATALMELCGFVELLPSEAMLDAATACLLPNYTLLALEAIADAAVLEGLPRATAQRLAANSVYSAAALAAHDPTVHPATLRNSAESPGGVTIRATRELERGGFRASIMDAVAAATGRSKELNSS
jgi:pyrroline-5-carboxylate reductase